MSLVEYIWAMAGNADTAYRYFPYVYPASPATFTNLKRSTKLSKNGTLLVVDDNFGTIGKFDGPNKPNSVLFSNLFTIKGDQLNCQLV